MPSSNFAKHHPTSMVHFFFFFNGLITYIRVQTSAIIEDSFEQWKTKQMLNL